jgi:hypothetical protein
LQGYDVLDLPDGDEIVCSAEQADDTTKEAREHLKSEAKSSSIRLGLCCIFLEQPIKFRNTTIKAISGMQHDAALAKSPRVTQILCRQRHRLLPDQQPNPAGEDPRRAGIRRARPA